MIDINSKPFLEYVLDYLKDEGVSKVILAVGYKHEVIKNYFGNNFKGIKLIYSIEEKPLGTGGALKLAGNFIDDTIFSVLNGDTLFKVSLYKLYSFHILKKAKITVALKIQANCYRYGKVGLDKDGQIITFFEKGIKEGGLINGGIYVMNYDIIEKIYSDVFLSLEKDILPDYINKGLFGLAFNSYFIDIGIPLDYYRAIKELKNKKYL
jgi:D-glycero-alpha-D-manno-heptose 1-phosphate guanylyltransferase